MKRKASKFDFKEEDLPSTRKELFFDILKNNYRVLLSIGATLLLFFMPFIVFSIVKDYTNYTFYNQLTSGTLNEEQYLSMVLVNNLVYDGINCLSLIILGIGVAGIIKIIKRLCFLDPVFFIEDFKSGVKDTGKVMGLLFFFIGVILLVNDYTYLTSSNLLTILPLCISLAVLFPTFLIMIMALAIYNLSFVKCLYVSFLLYIKSALKTLLAYVIFLVPFLVLLINQFFIKYLVFGVIIALILPIFIVFFFDYMCGVFDVMINATQYPEIYRKGLVDKNHNQ